MFKTIRTHLILLLAIAFAAPVLAATDPTLSQVYETAQAGHLRQAQQMMNQVLRDHPRSAKAHYVAAELYARQGNSSMARQELSTAQDLQPGLPFAQPESVRALQNELSQVQPGHVESGRVIPGHSQAPGSFSPGSFSPGSHSWGTVLAVLAGVGVLLLILRRRNSPGNVYSQYPGSQYPGGVPTAAGAPGNFGGPGVAPNVGTGVGSGIAGGLASGLAVGAGVVAGEELAHHFLDSDRHEGNVPPAANEPVDNPENSDMGGSDFGVSDDGSWDDDGGSVGGDVSGDDWT